MSELAAWKEHGFGGQKICLRDEGQVTSPLSLGFLPSQSNCQNTCHTYHLIVYVQPFAHTGAKHKHKACCVLSSCPSRLPPPPPWGSTWASLLSGFHSDLFSGNTGKRLVCKGRERGQVFIALAPSCPLGWVDGVQFYPRPHLPPRTTALTTPAPPPPRPSG